MSYPGTLYTISAPSGAGKTSLVQALTQSMNDITVSISHTTRPIRKGETEGVDYHFVEADAFSKLVEQEYFLEQAMVFSHYYGTARQWVEQQLVSGIDVILEIDWQGQQMVQRKIPEAVGIFILPPSKEALKMRLQLRNQDSEDVIDARMALATSEISHFKAYDYIIINDEFTTALLDLQAIVRARRLRQISQISKYEDLLNNLLK